MFSKTCEYAIRAIIYIALNTEEGQKVNIKKLSKSIDSPYHFTAKVLQTLARKDIIQSRKGPRGGFYLSEEALNQSLADIVKVIDGNKLFVGCGLGLGNCSEKNPCPIHHEYKKIRESLSEVLMKTKISDLKTIPNIGTRFKNEA